MKMKKGIFEVDGKIQHALLFDEESAMLDAVKLIESSPAEPTSEIKFRDRIVEILSRRPTHPYHVQRNIARSAMARNLGFSHGAALEFSGKVINMMVSEEVIKFEYGLLTMRGDS